MKTTAQYEGLNTSKLRFSPLGVRGVGCWQINAALLLLSSKENKEAELTTLLTERSQLLHEMMFAIDEDPDQTNPIGAKLALMQNEVNLDERYQRMQLNLAKEDYTTARALLEDAAADFQLSRIEQREVFDLKYLVELVAIEPQVLTAAQVNRLEQITSESGAWPSSWAAEILNVFGLHEITSPLYEIPEGQPRSAHLNDGDNKGAIILYPNPANNLVMVKGLLGQAGVLEIMDAVGKSLLSTSYNGETNEVPLDVALLSAGAYLVRVSDSQGKVQYLELVIQK
jgi:hypothetical protein